MPSKDRLGEFLAKTTRSSARSFRFQLHCNDQDEPKDKESNRVALSSHFSEKFLSKVETVTQGIDLLGKTVEQIRIIQQSILNSPLIENGYHHELEQTLMEFRRISLDIRNDLRGIDSDIAFAKKNDKSIDFRICITQRAVLGKKLTNVLSEYSRIQNEYRLRCQHRLQRQLQIVGRPALNQNELNEILDKGTGMLFTQGIIAETQSAKDALRDIEARHEELLALEKSIVEVRDLFSHLALLVENQGELVDRIETNITVSRDVASNAGSLLQEARAMRKSARRKKTKIIIFVTIAVIVIITVIVLGVYFGI